MPLGWVRADSLLPFTKTLEIREYPLPNSGARGKVVEWPSPSGPKSEPYGIVFTKGAIWYSESGTRPNTIVRFDPRTEIFQTWAIPSGGYIVRKMDVTPDGNPVIATSTVNGVGLVEVK